MKQTTILFTLVLLSTGLLQSCSPNASTPINPPKEKEKDASIMVIKPASIDSVDAGEITAIRALAQLNDWAADFASDNPKDWKETNMTISWEKVKEKKYIIRKISQGTEEKSNLKKLVLTDETNNLPHLTTIELTTPNLETLELGNLPSLSKLSLIGSVSSTLGKANLGILPALDSLSLSHFPNLVTSKDRDREFYLSEGYDKATSSVVSLQPKLRYIRLEDTGITDLYIQGGEVSIEEVVLPGNKVLDYLSIINSKLKETTFRGGDFPSLKTLRVKDIRQSNPIAIDGLPVLENLYVEKANGLQSITITNLPKLTNANLSGLGLTQNPRISGTPALTSIDLDDNKLTTVDLSSISGLRKVSLGSNDFSSTDNIKLPASVREIRAGGNEKLTKADFSPYKSLESITIPGIARGAESANRDQPLPLSELNLTGLTKLTKLNVRNNSISEIKVGDTKFASIENIDISDNALSIQSLAKICFAIMDAVRDGLLEEKESKLLEQRGLKTPRENNGLLDYSQMRKAFRDAGFSDEDFIVEVTGNPKDFTDNKEEGKVYFHTKSLFFITIKIGERYSIPLLKDELVKIEKPIAKS